VNDFMKLPVESRRRVFEEASARLGPPPASMEKDYWVFLALDGLFSDPSLSPRLTFKGGTSLSKA
jgi:predicted nucleotidyltransferase component of viral defense system